MNYAAIYGEIIARARDRVLEGYTERHHVVPRCMGGGNEATNIVRLTPEEHYLVHQLLVKANPNHPRLIHAATMMAKRCSGNKAYGWLRRRQANLLRGKPLSKETRAKISAAHKGKKQSPRPAEMYAKIGAAHRGKTVSLETRAKLAAANIGKKQSPELIEKRIAPLRGRKQRHTRIVSDETKRKLSLAGLGNKRTLGFKASAETKRKLSIAKSMPRLCGRWSMRFAACRICCGVDIPHQARGLCVRCYGIEWSAKRREKMPPHLRGPAKSHEHRAKISASNRAFVARRKEMLNGERICRE